MGCAQSRIENEESVSRCRERRNLLKEAIYARKAFASAHSGFSVSLKDTGAALTDYTEGEVPPPPMVAAAPSDTPPPPAPMTSSLPPPPPPLPSFSPMPPLQRAVTMATALSSKNRKEKMKGIAIEKSDIYEDEEEEKEGFHRRKKGVESPKKASPNPTTPPEIRGLAWDYFFMDNMPNEGEEEEEGYGEGVHVNIEAKFDNVGENTEFRTPEKKVRFEGIEEFKTPVGPPVVKKFLHSNTAPPAMSRVVNGGNVVGNINNNGVDFLKIVSDIDDHFVKAYQSSQEVSKMLEATRLHYHSNFADNRGDHTLCSGFGL